MQFSLINPPWTFDGSIYFGCREPHLPLEYGYSQALLERAGHEVELVDAQLDGLTLDEMRARVRAFRARFHRGHHRAELSVLAMRAAGAARAAETVRRAARRRRHAWSPWARTPPQRRRDAAEARASMSWCMGECEEILPQLAGDAGSDVLDCLLATASIGCRAAPHAARHDRAPGAALGARDDRAAPPPPSPLRRAADRTGCGDGDVARLPVPLHVLRQGQLPGPLTAAARGDHRSRSSTG